jgi:hypothetical protein
MSFDAASDNKLRRRSFCGLLAATVTGCSKPPVEKRRFYPLAQPEAWELIADIPHTGQIQVKEGQIRIESGKPITAVRYTDWEREQMPVVDYRVSWECMRADGTDFFTALTFPVRRMTDCCTLVLGAWGGGLVGISNIDDRDANENGTRSEHYFERGKWYGVRLEVRADSLQVWLNDSRVVNVWIEGHKISMRPGEIESCVPFGLATYWTTGCVRGLLVEEI